jgi:thioredoxin-like negative regulator of GroEL
VPGTPIFVTLGEIVEEQAGRLIVAKLNIDDNPATVGTCQVWSMPLMGFVPRR